MRSIKRPAQILLGVIVAATLASFAAARLSPSVGWRLRLLGEKLTGQIPQIPLPQLVEWALPDSPVNLYRLAQTKNVNASISNTFTDRAASAAGAQIFGHVCAQCHGDQARGGVGPNLVAAIGGMTDWQFLSTVKWGRPGTLMHPQPLSVRQIWEVDAFIRQTALDAAMGRKYAPHRLPPYRPVTTAMLRSAGQHGQWLTYAGDYAGTRHSRLTQITPKDVADLRLAWAAQVPTNGGDVEASPIVVGRRMFVTEPADRVTALNAKNGRPLWQFHRALPHGMSQCCGEPNRGVAVFGDNVYVATFDDHLIALAAATGAKVWDTKVADWHQAYTMTGAPLAADGRIVVGVAGGDFGVRGFIAAYSASTGKQQWRFYTVPAPGQPGHNTWGGNSWIHGGAATWVTGSYDPKLGLIYWGTGNPGPDFNAKARPGTNLYSDSIVALDARTGRLRWYYQFTPSDDHGWDSTEQPVLADIHWHGQVVPALLLANRNGFFYALNRSTGQFLFAKPFAEETWASGYTKTGRPILLAGAQPTSSGTVASPPAWGATSWWPPSFDPARDLMFVPSVDSSDIFFNVASEDYHQGRSYLASGFVRAPDRPTTLALRAIDAATGTLRWNSTIEIGGGEVPGEMGGVLSTGGGVVFAGHGEQFDAYDADTGTLLWSTPLGGVVHAAPISYALADKQYIAVFGGRTLFVFALPRTYSVLQKTAVRATPSTPAPHSPANAARANSPSQHSRLRHASHPRKNRH